MEDGGGAGVDDAPAGAAGAQAPVDVLVVAEQRLVQQPDLLERGAPPEVAVADRHVDVAGVAPSRPVGLAGAVAAHRERSVGQRVVRAPQPRRILEEQVAGAGNGDMRIGFRHPHELADEVGGHLGVAVDQQDVVGAARERPADAYVVAAGVPKVRRVADDLKLRMGGVIRLI